MATLVAHAAAWSALEVAPTTREPARPAPAALVWLETPTVLTANADTDADARQIAPVRPQPQARVRPRAPARLMARTCTSTPPALPGLEVSAPVLTGASADGSPSGSAAQTGTPVLAAAAGGGVPGAGSAREGAPAPRAQLLSNHPCAGDFPGQAAVDIGEVQVDVAVDVSGHAALSSVLLERPLGQGFAQAAQACARKLLFAPAHDGSGAAVPVHAKLRLVFKRV